MSCNQCCGFSKSNSKTHPSAIVLTQPQQQQIRKLVWYTISYPGVNPQLLPYWNQDFLPRGVRGVLVSHASDISRACSRPSPENPFFCPQPAAIAAAAGHSIVRTNGLPACLEDREGGRGRGLKGQAFNLLFRSRGRRSCSAHTTTQQSTEYSFPLRPLQDQSVCLAKPKR